MKQYLESSVNTGRSSVILSKLTMSCQDLQRVRLLILIFNSVVATPFHSVILKLAQICSGIELRKIMGVLIIYCLASMITKLRLESL